LPSISSLSILRHLIPFRLMSLHVVSFRFPSLRPASLY
jgi:hypothetical protein